MHPLIQPGLGTCAIRSKPPGTHPTFVYIEGHLMELYNALQVFQDLGDHFHDNHAIQALVYTLETLQCLRRTIFFAQVLKLQLLARCETALQLRRYGTDPDRSRA